MSSLRVVDASIMPGVVSGKLNAPVIMVPSWSSTSHSHSHSRGTRLSGSMAAAKRATISGSDNS